MSSTKQGTEQWRGRFAWFAPYLFGLLIYTSVKHHSWEPVGTLPGVVQNLIAAVVIFFLLGLGRGVRLTFPRGIAELVLAMMIASAVSLVASTDLAVAVTRLLLYWVVALFGVSTYLLYRDAEQIPVASYCFAIAVVYVPLLVEVVLELIRAGGQLPSHWPRVANFSNVRHFGYVAFLAAMAATALVACRFLVPVSFILVCSALFGIIATGSRGALLSWVAFVVLVALLGASAKRIILHSLAAVVTTLLVVWLLHVSGTLETPNIVGRAEQVLDGSANFDSGRLQLWHDVLQEIAAYPFFGQGPEAYVLSGCCDRGVFSPHNFILQLMMEFGLLGALIMILLIWRIVASVRGTYGLTAAIKSNPKTVILASMVVAQLGFSLIDGLLYQAVPLMHFALFCGLLAAGLRRHNDVVMKCRNPDVGKGSS